MFNAEIEAFTIVAMKRITKEARKYIKKGQELESGSESDANELANKLEAIKYQSIAQGFLDAFRILRDTHDEYKNFEDEEEREAKWDWDRICWEEKEDDN